MQISAPWDGNTTGDAVAVTPLSSDRWTEFWQTFFSSGDVGDEDRGVFRGYLDELEVVPSWRRAPEDRDASPLWVSSGAAVVRGRWYKNDGRVDVYVSMPEASTRTDRVVLRCSWAAQTVRIEMLTNPTEGTGSPPALTQSNGVTWEIPLATATVTTGGIVTVTDERSWIYVGEHRTVSVFADALGRADGEPPSGYRGVELEDGAANYARAEWMVPSDYVSDMEISAIVVTDTAVTGAGYVRANLRMAAAACGEKLTYQSPPGKRTGMVRVYFSAADLGEYKAALTIRPESGIVAGQRMRIDFYRWDNGGDIDTLPGSLWCPGFRISYLSDSG